MRRLLALTVPLVFVLALVPACSSGSGERVTIYSGRTENLIGPILEDFADQTGISVDVKYGDSADLALLVSEEGSSSPADVFLSQSPGAVGFLDDRDLLASLSEEVLALVPDEDEASDGDWIGFSGRQRVLAYNTELVDPTTLPDSVLDLTLPEYAGRVAVAPTNGSFQDFITAMRAELGDDAAAEWLAGMADNGAKIYANNNAIVEAIGRGEVEMGLINHYYTFRALAEDPDLPVANYEFPPEDLGSLLIVTSAAVLESSEHKDSAEELVQFLLNEQAQRFFADETFEYPLAADVEPPKGLQRHEDLAGYRVDYDDLGSGFGETVEMIEQSGLGS